ncbi:FAD-dependent oxidoreductase [Bordetella sp. BOR01]|uniref:NAD(P)/FAD-dependent oxidoreductase n=1 Tax=Bordetella sp. BOR01 TaxID=2854779 RepID=UPI001C457E7E|nr:FAD-binding oxidoreductase [Bordetella sp. BOR01]
MKKVVVIGAGVVGANIALRLQRDGCQVVLAEAIEPGRQCSYGNGGAISPDFCVPFALPGVIKRVPHWLMDPLGPLVIRWGYLPTAVPWLWQWFKQSKLEQVWKNSRAMRALHKPSLELYEQLLGPRAHGLVERGGSLYVWKTPRASPTEELARKLREAQGIQVQQVSSEQILDIDPALNPEYKHGLYFPDNGHTVNPFRLVQELVALFVEAGGIVQRINVESFIWRDGKVVGVLGNGSEWLADDFVIATGIDGNRLARQVGERTPMIAERGYHAMLAAGKNGPALKVSNREHMFGMAPMELGVRVAGTVEMANPRSKPDYRRAQALVARAKEMYPALEIHNPLYWIGCRPSTPDSLPVVDRARRAPNVVMAYGHGHSGVIGGPMTARIVRGLLLGDMPGIDVAPYAAGRF